MTIYRTRRWVGFAVVLLVSVCGTGALGADDAPAPEAVTTGDPEIPTDQLKLLLKPLTQDELVVEADAWLALLKAKVSQISQAEIRVKTASQEMKEAEEDAERPSEVKSETLEDLRVLREQRAALVDRFNLVLTELEAKGGDRAGHDQYVAAVSGIIAAIDVTDTHATWNAIVGWLKSKEGGLRWGGNILKFIVTLIVFWILSRVVGKAVQKSLELSRKMSELLRDFTVRFTQRALLFVGLMVAITMLEVNIGPVLAVIAAAGFVVGFALQGTLSNFASGLMILAYRPFDIGDVINAGGVAGTVESMNLVSTYVKTFDNQRVIVPNNAIWGGVITNVTGMPTRRVDMVFGIGYGDDMGKAKSILEEILKNHAKVLEDPAPVVRIHELGDSSVNLICRPWVKTADYWDVYWDVTRTAKERFDATGISIPFPQRDVHVHQTASD